MADTATRTLDAIRNGLRTGEYVEIPNVPLFDAHDEYDTRRYIRDPKTQQAVANPKFGSLVRRFDAGRLQAIVQRNQQRERSSGDLPPIGPGHTIPDPHVPETMQPPVWGYAGNLRVGNFGPDGSKVGILGSIYARAEHAEKVRRDFPRRSIELIPGDEFIDWVALLRRSPQRDLGLLAYSRELYSAGQSRFCPWEKETNFRPSADPSGSRPLSAAVGADGKLRYSMDFADKEGSMPDTLPPGAGAPAPDADLNLSPDEQKRFWRYMRSVCDRYAQEAPPPPTPGMPGAGSAIPGSGPPVGIPEDDKTRMQRESEATRYARLEADFQALKQERDAERYARKKADCERQVVQLESEGYQLDRAVEVNRMLTMDDAGQKAHVDSIRRFYRCAPTGNYMVNTGPIPGSDMVNGEIPAERRHKAIRYMRENPGIQWDQALAACPN